MTIEDRIKHLRLAGAANVLSASECEALIQIGQSHLKKAQVVDNETGTALAHAERTGETAWPDRSAYPILQDLSERIAGWTGIPASHQEPLQMVHYGVGFEYKAHFDAFPPGSACLQTGGNRVCTLVFYLNDVIQGGETVFPRLGVKVHPRQGSMAFFRSIDAGEIIPDSLHAGAPVLAGEKWIATQWIRERPYQ